MSYTSFTLNFALLTENRKHRFRTLTHAFESLTIMFGQPKLKSLAVAQVEDKLAVACASEKVIDRLHVSGSITLQIDPTRNRNDAKSVVILFFFVSIDKSYNVISF